MILKLLVGILRKDSLHQDVFGLNTLLKRQLQHFSIKGERVVIGHSVTELLEKAKVYDKNLKVLISSGIVLDRFYIHIRYPNGLPGGIPAYTYKKKDDLEAIKLAQKILDFISDILE